MSKQTFTTGQVLTAQEMTDLQKNDYNQTVSAKVASYVLVASDAGTRITMANASATTITVNTALFTAGDTLTITNISTGVCTITPGTATVSTAGSLALQQYDSGTLYFTSTGVSIWNGANPGDITGVTAGTGISGGGTSGTVTVTNSMATEITAAGDIIVGTGSGTFDNLPIGTTAQILTADTTVSPYKVKWATPAAVSSGMTFIQRSTFSNVANTSTTFDSVFSTTYATYSIVIENCTAATAGDNLQFQFRYAGPTTQATTNIWSNYTTTIYSGAQAMTFGNNTSVIELAQDTGSSSERSTGQYWINDYQTSSVLALFGSTIVRNAVSGVQVYAYQYTARTYTGFILSSSSSNISGTVTIYGLAKS